jgi:hypothetical protein
MGAAVSIPNLDLLAEEGFAWVAQRARLTPEPSRVDPADKFIIRSALQKAVRRAQTDRAVELALRLHRIDRAYVWRAALTVAVEDVGLGSPQAVLWATVAQSAPFRHRVGELPLLIALVREMSQALKSRAACELAFVVDTGEPEVFRRFGQMTTAQLLARVEDADPYEAYAALAVLRGVVPKGYRLRPPDREGVLRTQEIIHNQLPFHHARAAATALMRPLDEMSIAVFPAFRLGHDAGDAEIVGDKFPEGHLIGSYPTEAYDQHERLGRRAIRRFARDLRKRHAAFRQLPEPTIHAAVADAVFIEEGQCLNRWIGSSDLRRLRREADDWSLTRHGLAQPSGHAVREIVRSAIPELNDHREAVIRDAGRH